MQDGEERSLVVLRSLCRVLKGEEVEGREEYKKVNVGFFFFIRYRHLSFLFLFFFLNNKGIFIMKEVKIENWTRMMDKWMDGSSFEFFLRILDFFKKRNFVRFHFIVEDLEKIDISIQCLLIKVSYEG